MEQHEIDEVNKIVRQKDLKSQGLLERIGQQSSQYEDTIADLRVQLTEQNEELQELRQKLQETEQRVVEHDYTESHGFTEQPVVQGEVVNDETSE